MPNQGKKGNYFFFFCIFSHLQIRRGNKIFNELLELEYRLNLDKCPDKKSQIIFVLECERKGEANGSEISAGDLNDPGRFEFDKKGQMRRGSVD